MKSGIYKFTFENGRFYIGSAKDLRARRSSHLSAMRRGKHGNVIVQRCFYKYGPPKFETLIVCDQQDLIFFEQRAIDSLKPNLNICKIAGNTLGRKHTKASRLRLCEVAKDRATKDTWIDKVSETWFKKGSKKLPNSLSADEARVHALKKTRKKIWVTETFTGRRILFQSIKDASEFVGGPNRCCISHRLTGRLTGDYNGYTFEYAV